MAEYTTGKVSQVDVLRAQMAVTRLNEHMIELGAGARLGRGAVECAAGPASRCRRWRSPEPTQSHRRVPAIEELEQVAIDHRPELAALRKQIATARDEGHLARMAAKPDFTVGLGYMLMPTGSMARNAYMAEFSMNLPRWNRDRHDGEAKQADAATAVTQAELDMRSNAVFLEVRQAQIEVWRPREAREALPRHAHAAGRCGVQGGDGRLPEQSRRVRQPDRQPEHAARY